MELLNKVIEAYYKVEDKWFDFLDFLDSKKIPVYSIVDPLEKHGVPSFLLFLGVILVLAYFFLSPGGVPVNQVVLQVTDGENPVYAHVMILTPDGKTAFESNVNGSVQLMLKPGNYFARVSAEGCTDVENYSVLVSEEVPEVSIVLDCQQRPKTKLVSVCFDSDNLGAVTVYKKVGSRIPDCTQGSDICSLLVEETEEKNYKFKTQSGLVSDYYSGKDLIRLENLNKCVHLYPYLDPSVPKGKVYVLVKTKDGKKVLGAIVKLFKANTSYELSKSATHVEGNLSGFAEFTLPVGTRFYVKVEPSNMSIAFTDENIYEVKEGVNNVEVTIDPGVSSMITVLAESETGTVPVDNAFITLFDSYLSEDSRQGPFKTDSNGKKIINLVKGADYVGFVWKKGFNVSRFELKGGENKTIYLEKAAPGTTGDVHVIVGFKDSKAAIPNAFVYLFKDGKPTGIPSQPEKTSYNGEAWFYSVPVGDGYCVKVVRKFGESECVDVGEDGKVSLGTNTVVVEVDPISFDIDVNVSVEGEQAQEEVEVEAVDKNLGEVIASANVNKLTGFASLTINEGTDVEIKGYYSNSSGSYSGVIDLGRIEDYVENHGKVVNLDLEKVGNNISIISPSTTLNKGVTYYFTILLGTENTTLWQKATIILYDEDGYFEFKEPSSTYVTSVTGAGTSKMEISINVEELRERTLNLRIPIRIKTYAPNSVSFKYNASWVKEEKAGEKVDRDPGSGAYTAGPYTATGSVCRKAENGELSVCLPTYVNSIEIGATNEFEVAVVNEGTNALSGSSLSLKVKNYYENAVFSLVKVKLGDIETSGSISDDGFEVSVPSDLTIDPGEKLSLNITMLGIGGGPVQVDLLKDGKIITLDDGSEASVSFSVTGTSQVEIIVSPEPLTELSTEMNISLMAGTGAYKREVPASEWSYYTSVSGLTCDIQNLASNSWSKAYGNTYSIVFDNDCKPSRSKKVTVSFLPPEGYSYAPAEKQVEVSRCINLPSSVQTLFLPFTAPTEQKEVTITLKQGQSAKSYVTSSNSFSEGMEVNYSANCEYDSLTVTASTGAVFSSASVSKSSEGWVIIYSYSKQKEGGEETSKDVINLKLTFKKGGITSEYTLSIPVLIATELSAETLSLTGISVVPIQKYGEDYNCEYDYCTISQALKYAYDHRGQGSLTLKLLRTGSLTLQDIQKIYSNIGITTDVIDESTLAQGTPSEFSILSDPDSFNFGEAGNYLFSISKNTLREVTPLDSGSDVTKAFYQLQLNKLTDDGNINNQINFGLYPSHGDKAAWDDDQLKGIADEFSSLARTFFGIPESDSSNYGPFVYGSDHRTYVIVKLVKCDAEKIQESGNDCSIIDSDVGGLNNLRGVIAYYPQGIGRISYPTLVFASLSYDGLEEMVERYFNTLEGNYQLSIYENNGFYFLSTAPKVLRVFCAGKSDECSKVSDEIRNEGSMLTALRKFYAVEAGYNPDEIGVVEKSDERQADLKLVFCTDFTESGCEDEQGKYSQLMNNVFGANINEVFTTNVPVNGILFKLSGTQEGSNLRYYLYAWNTSSAQRLLEEYYNAYWQQPEYESSQISTAICGNGVVESGEVCEIGDTIDCGNLKGYKPGNAATCLDDCSGWDTSNCIPESQISPK